MKPPLAATRLQHTATTKPSFGPVAIDANTYGLRTRSYTPQSGAAAERRGHSESFLAKLRAALRKRIRGAFSPQQQMLRWGEMVRETAIASLGAVDIRLSPSIFAVQTCAKGELDAARDTALKRLAKYVNGENGSAAILPTARPVVQQQETSNRWFVRVSLPTVNSALAAPNPCMQKVQVIELEPRTLAILRVAGRPTRSSVARGKAAILTALANTDWRATGPTMIRMHAPPSFLPFLGSFEVAVPVIARGSDLDTESTDILSDCRPNTLPGRRAH